jgi:hypothetical protein
MTGRKISRSPYSSLVLCLLLTAPFFFLRGVGVFDDSLFLKTGEMIAQGALPYRDFYDNKPPGVYYVGALIAWLGGGHWLAPRVFLFLFALAFGVCVVAFVRRRFGDRAGHRAAWLFGLSHVLAQGYSLHTEALCGFFGFLAACAVAGGRKRNVAAWFTAGALTGLAVLFKQPAVLYLVSLAGVLTILAFLGTIPWRRYLTSLVLLGLGSAAVIGVVAFGLIALGVGAEAYDEAVVVAFQSAKLPLNLRAAVATWLRVPAVPLSFLAAGLLLVSRALRARLLRLPDAADLLLWMGAGFLSLLPTLRIGGEQGHYCGPAVWGLTLTCIAVWSALPDAALAPAARPSLRNFSTWFVRLQLLAYVGVALAGEVLLLRQGRLAADLQQLREIRQVLQERLPDKESILCLSETPSRLYYMSGRRPAVKYLFFLWNIEDKFSKADARDLLCRGGVAGAILETQLASVTPGSEVGLKEGDWEHVNSLYEVIPLQTGVHPYYQTRTMILIRRALD